MPEDTPNPIPPVPEPAATERTETVIAQTTTGPQKERVDFVLLLLFAGILIYTVLLLLVEKLFANDGQIFQIIAGLVTAFSGAFFGRMLPAARTPK